jgi:hypothetical protein
MVARHSPSRSRTNCQKAFRHTPTSRILRARHDKPMAGIQNQRQRAGPNEDTPNEARFARQDQGRYSGWSSAIAIIAILIVLAIVFLVYQLKY